MTRKVGESCTDAVHPAGEQLRSRPSHFSSGLFVCFVYFVVTQLPFQGSNLHRTIHGQLRHPGSNTHPAVNPPLPGGELKCRRDRRWLPSLEGLGGGHPLRRGVNGKKLSVPDFFVLGLAHALSGGFKGLDPSLRFRCSILDSPHPAAIRSVTHLVLAPVPYAAVLRSLFRTERSRPMARLPPARFSWAPVSYARRPRPSSRSRLAPIPRTRDQKTFSAGPCSFSS